MNTKAKITFSNPWMRLENDISGKQFIVSDKQKFLVMLVTNDTIVVNEHCQDNPGHSLITTDSNGLHYVVKDKASN